MGKAERNRQQNARQRIARQQAAAKRAEARRRVLIAGGSALAVVAIVVALVVVKSLNGPSTAAVKSTPATSNAALVRQITSLPASELDKVGSGPTGSAAVVPLKAITGPALTLNGKPEMLYVGAEFCPFCAAERWSMVVALSRFGTFSNLGFIHSTPNDIYSNTSTLTFYKSSYTSKYLSFLPRETEDVAEKPLEQITKAQNALLVKYTHSSFPFVDVGGKYIVDQAQYLPSVLGSPETQDATHHGLSWQQIATDLQNPNNPVAQEIIGAANRITAAICQVTGAQPAAVCKSTSVTSVNGSI